ncbi:hypothetical protein N7495_006221 [Penicillium taxi]|uniref:uncharacterized protein n=1 Tax=Penicillium taxi TaxID=168475 RepID=UPI0025453069|nr:uncharacterized protein N7495_006221 [Penicillium taxi]KAJ5894530.1 hypothetical protein N7495_006221 [Penicillium taxi]
MIVPRNSEFVHCPEGTEVSFAERDKFSSQAWVIVEKLNETLESERSRLLQEASGYLTDHQVTLDGTPAWMYRRGYQVCRCGRGNAGLNRQSGEETTEARRAQPGEHIDLTALQIMNKLAYHAVPKLHRYKELKTKVVLLRAVTLFISSRINSPATF